MNPFDQMHESFGREHYGEGCEELRRRMELEDNPQGLIRVLSKLIEEETSEHEEKIRVALEKTREHPKSRRLYEELYSTSRRSLPYLSKRKNKRNIIGCRVSGTIGGYALSFWKTLLPFYESFDIISTVEPDKRLILMTRGRGFFESFLDVSVQGLNNEGKGCGTIEHYRYIGDRIRREGK